MVIITKEVPIITMEEVIFILEEVFVLIILDVAKKGIDPLSVDTLVRRRKVTKILRFKETLRVHQVNLRLEKI